MKKIIGAFVISIFILLAGCQDDNANLDNNSNTADEKTAILYTNMETGSESATFKEHEWLYKGELSAEILAEGLSQTTGLDFTISVTKVDDGYSIDWKTNSTLIANIDEREQKEEFHLFDSESMRWFMMDSLWLTLTKNLNTDNIYYTMDGGKDLSFEELQPVNEFPSDLPYMGSAFFFSHADGAGEADDTPQG